MIPFKGKIRMKQYIKNTPKKWGIKVFTRADVTGLDYDFEVYTAKGTVPNERGPDPVDRCRWSKEKKEYVEVDRPHIVKVYNNNMGGVDLADMFAALYRIELRPRRWYLRILYYLIDLLLVNGWLLYHHHLTQKQEKKYMPFLDFRTQVADALIKVG
ncbi:piggyBac transposable element-derived protein 3-like [Hippocampus comes]|uniref:piggyBac transposable element-derived protein 3-like n=1 Tax=Hippocampus comes TaxID=109280 RepID=UPI00094F21D0|nr:PREDICTED: piggyBac transposable element-derived protein 3-like [Hippocampus comes]